MSKQNTTLTARMEAFTRAAILALRKPGYKGIHVVYSGFNAAFEAEFGVKSKDALKPLVDAGKFASHFAKGGVMLYLPEDAPKASESKAAVNALAAIKAQMATA